MFQPDASSQNSTFRILVVDDSPTVLHFTSRSLIEAGHQVETSDHIWVAPQVTTFDPHLVLLDCDMGWTSGMIALEALRAWKTSHQLKLVFYSSLDREELEHLSRKHRADGYIMKSDDSDALRARVSEFLGT